MQDRDFTACPYSDVSEFKRDVPSPDENDAPRQRFQLEELVTLRNVLFSRNPQFSRHRSRCNEHVTTLQKILSNFENCRLHKARSSMKRPNTRVGKALLTALRHRVSKGSFKCHQLWPFDSSALSLYASAVHPAHPIDHFSGSNEYFLWITSTKGAGTAERPRINNGDLPTGGAAFLGDNRRCIASPDYHEIELLSHDGGPQGAIPAATRPTLLNRPSP